MGHEDFSSDGGRDFQPPILILLSGKGEGRSPLKEFISLIDACLASSEFPETRHEHSSLVSYLVLLPVIALCYMNQNPLLQPLNCVVLFSGCSMPWNLLTSMICLSIFWGRLSYSLADFNSQENRASWLFKFSATVVGIAVAAYAWRCSKRRLGKLHEVDGADDSELTCFCGLPAKLRISRTSKNPYRLFYSCPKNAYFHQCKFFRWSDEIPIDSERHLEEKSFLRDECIHLQEKVDLILSQRQQERIDWDRKEEELRSQLTVVQSELDDVNKRIQEVNESEEMPPVDASYHVDDELDGAVVLGTV